MAAKVIGMAQARTTQPFVHFNRTELTLLVNLCARRVASGEWRDYAIDQGAGRAVFSIYRHTPDQPLFTITKLGPGNGKAAQFEVALAERLLARSGSLAEALQVIERQPWQIV